VRPRTVKLVVDEDKDYGTTGLFVEENRFRDGMNASTSGVLMAHDLIEHVNGVREIGPINDELEAMGAIWFTRGQHWDIVRDNPYGAARPPQEHIAADLSRMFCVWSYGEHASPLRNRAGDHEHDLRDCIDHARSDARNELDDSRTDFSELWREYSHIALTRMRAGFRKARRMYGDSANELFWAIAEAVEPHAKSAESGDWSPGFEFELTYGHRNGRVFAECRPVEPEYY
jgi:hypothetical protein